MTNRLAELEPVIANLLASVDAPGAVVALSVDGELSVRAVGFADIECTVPLETDALFGLYSITKMLISTLMLRLEEGIESFSLNDVLQDRLPDFSIQRPVQIRQVLNHTGGLPDYGALPAYQAALREHPEQAWSRREFLAQTLGDDLLFIPGHGWRYSNIGYLLLRQILEEETGLSLAPMLRLYLGQPLGLTSLSAVSTLAEMADLTPGFSAVLRDDGVVENVIPRYHPGWVAHGLAVASAEDVARFLHLLFVEQRVVSADLVAEMLVGAPVAENHRWMVKPAYGLGLMMDPANPYGVVAGHTGGGPGYATAAYHFADVGGHRVNAVALVNRDGSDVATDIVFSLARELAAG